MQVKTKGIVHSETPYGETSKILNVLTDSYGMISVISKGCRNVKSKLRGISNKMNYAEYVISYKEKGISTLIEGVLIDSFKNTYSNMKMAVYSFYLLDLVHQVLKENNNKELFHLLVHALIKINNYLSPELISSLLELQLLKYLGVDLSLLACTNCGNMSDLITLSLQDGGALCQNCCHYEQVMDQRTLKLMQVLSQVDIAKIQELAITDDLVYQEMDTFLYEYYLTYTGIYMKKKQEMLKFV